jgi:RHH-type rel operon transcriptional repressor/antitoxin RelB
MLQSKYTMYTSLIIMPHPQPPHQAVTLSIRIQPEARDQLEILAHATGRTKSFLAAEAIEHYLSIQTWQINGIKKSIKKADGKNACFIEHERVLAWLASWGDDNEQEPPK